MIPPFFFKYVLKKSKDYKKKLKKNKKLRIAKKKKTKNHK